MYPPASTAWPRGELRGRIGRSQAPQRTELLGITGDQRAPLHSPTVWEVPGDGKARAVVVKSRGHFRAGFDEFFSPERIFEVDCPGLTSPALHSFRWTRLPRPVPEKSRSGRMRSR